MKYVATVEIEFETDGDPIDRTHTLMHRALNLSSAHKNLPPVKAEHYHIVEQPKELK